MFRYFRRLRQRVLSENRFSKYLLYAIGEIFLVMVGILLALQVNNWNEARKLREQEYTLLRDLRSDLQETLSDLQFGKTLNESTVTNYRILLKAIDNDESPSPKIDSASQYINYFHVPRFRRTTYESLKSTPEMLSNDSLKRAIADVYDRQFTYLTDDQLEVEWSVFKNQTLDFSSMYLRYKDSDVPEVFPVDFEQMKSDQNFINYLSTLVSIRKYGVVQYENAISRIQKIINYIDAEMGERE